jgi:hypothetical protein
MQPAPGLDCGSRGAAPQRKSGPCFAAWFCCGISSSRAPRTSPQRGIGEARGSTLPASAPYAKQPSGRRCGVGAQTRSPNWSTRQDRDEQEWRSRACATNPARANPLVKTIVPPYGRVNSFTAYFGAVSAHFCHEFFASFTRRSTSLRTQKGAVEAAPPLVSVSRRVVLYGCGAVGTEGGPSPGAGGGPSSASPCGGLPAGGGVPAAGPGAAPFAGPP